MTSADMILECMRNREFFEKSHGSTVSFRLVRYSDTVNFTGLHTSNREKKSHEYEYELQFLILIILQKLINSIVNIMKSIIKRNKKIKSIIILMHNKIKLSN